MYVPKWLLFIFGMVAISPYVSLLVAIFWPRYYVTEQEQDTILVALIEERKKELQLERMVENDRDWSANTREPN